MKKETLQLPNSHEVMNHITPILQNIAIERELYLYSLSINGDCVKYDMRKLDLSEKVSSEILIYCELNNNEFRYFGKTLSALRIGGKRKNMEITYIHDLEELINDTIDSMKLPI